MKIKLGIVLVFVAYLTIVGSSIQAEVVVSGVQVKTTDNEVSSITNNRENEIKSAIRSLETGDSNSELSTGDVRFLSYDEVVVDSIVPATEADLFSFDATVGTTVKLNAFTVTGNLDPRIELYNPDGLLVETFGCDAGSFSRCSFSADLTPLVTGRYSLRVFDDDGSNTGSYNFSLWCVFGECGGVLVPDPDGPELPYVLSTEDSIDPFTDGDFYTFNANVGSTINFRGITLSSGLDPRIEVRDPSGNIVVDGLIDGAGCDASAASRCNFDFSLSPSVPGLYSLRISDDDSFNTGTYQLSLLCVLGDCDGDSDGLFDGDRQALSYGIQLTDNGIEPSTEGDFYEFRGSSGDEIKITVASQTNGFDPRIRIHDSARNLVVDGIVDGGGCDATILSQCSFSVSFSPELTGVYSLVVFDSSGFNVGEYDILLECVFGIGPGFGCIDIEIPPFLCADNCSAVYNPLQRDTDSDGYGNFCDPDFNNDGSVNFSDISSWVPFFGTACGDVDQDINGDGLCNFVDFSILTELFLSPTGPSCSYPNFH